MPEINDKIIKGYFVFLVGGLLPVLSTTMMMVVFPVYVFYTWAALLFVTLPVILLIVSLILVFYGLYFMIMEGLLADTRSEAKNVLLAGLSIFLIGIGWTVIFWNLGWSWYWWVFSSLVLGSMGILFMIALGILQIVLGLVFVVKTYREYKGSSKIT